jgi:DegV family protein with EDD domain
MTDPQPDQGAPAGSVAVVTDTTSYVPGEMLDSLGVQCVSLYVGWDGKLTPERDYTDLDAFYERLKSEPRLPTTSQPSVGDFLDVYRPLAEAGRDIYSIHIAEALSGTCQSAREAARTLAAEGHTAKVTVVDAATGAGGLGLLVIAAAEAARAGAGIDEVAETIERRRKGLKIYFCLDTLEYLRRGGRIGAAQAMVGTALKVKPILTFGTEIAPVDRVRTSARAYARMGEYLTEMHAAGARTWTVQKIQCEGPAAEMIERGRAVYGCEPCFVSEVGPVFCTHLGSGLLVGAF